jgi:ATP adenylyltransferase
MQRMWSPWRSEYVESAAQRSTGDAGHSLFTHLEQEGNDEENLIVWRGERVFVIMNRYPYNNGHLLIVPYHEVQAYDALTPEEQMAIARTIDRCMRWLRHALDPDGFNVGMNLEDGSGAGLPEHLHVHVVPRWSGDTNFMTTTHETRVLPESLAATYERLQNAIEAVEDASTPSP